MGGGDLNWQIENGKKNFIDILKIQYLKWTIHLDGLNGILKIVKSWFALKITEISKLL